MDDEADVPSENEFKNDIRPSTRITKGNNAKPLIAPSNIEKL